MSLGARVARLMRRMGLRGAVRGRRIKTTVPAALAERPIDLVERDFAVERPNRLWVSDLTYGGPRRGFAGDITSPSSSTLSLGES